MIPHVQCAKCQQSNADDAFACIHCGSSLRIAALEIIRGNPPERVHFLRPCSYTVGRARQNDLLISEPSISKYHARIHYEDNRFFIEDQGSLHGVYINGKKIERGELVAGCEVQIGNITLRFTRLDNEGSTGDVAQLPWLEQQQLLLSLIQTLNSTLVLSQVLEQVVDAVMRVTRAERGFLLLADDAPDSDDFHRVAGLSMRVARAQDGSPLPADVQGISTSVISLSLDKGEVVATENATADPIFGSAQSVILKNLRTIVCIPLLSPRAEADGKCGRDVILGVLYVDNHAASAPFSAESLKTAEALARHAALAIENAQLFERERRSLEELRLAQQQLLQAEKLATIGRMAAGIAHELNTPLTYIMGNVELLQMQNLGVSEQELLGSISKGAQRLLGLSQDLLKFSRPAQEELMPASLNSAIESSLEFCRYAIIKHSIKVDRQLQSPLANIQGSPNMLETAFINLIINAIQAMEKGGCLSVRTRTQNGNIEVAIADTGHGIPPALQASIFEPFVTTKPEGEGTGLGLSTVLMVVEHHNGKIDFTSSEQGTTFRLTFPAC